MDKIKGITQNIHLLHNIRRKIKEGKYKCILLKVTQKKK